MIHGNGNGVHVDGKVFIEGDIDAVIISLQYQRYCDRWGYLSSIVVVEQCRHGDTCIEHGVAV